MVKSVAYRRAGSAIACFSEISHCFILINFTFFNIRIKRNPAAELYIDNICGLYDFIKPILVNDGMMDLNDDSNIIMSFDELRTILSNRQETVKVKPVDDYHGDWIIKCKKGDINGN